ncbi:MAG: ABC transporter permease [Chloroflexota bacterium]|nr:ABC transporter permease [Chloroflexota bacterium]
MSLSGDQSLPFGSTRLDQAPNSLGGRVQQRSLWGQAWRAFRRDRIAVVALVLVAIVAVAAVLAPVVSPYPPNEANNRLRLAGIDTSGHPLGLDEQGRDILSRLIWGGRVSLPTALLPTAIAALSSLVLGLAAGFYGGLVSGIIMRTMDVFFAFPVVILAIGIAGILGPSLTNVMLSLTIVLVPYITRIVYAATVEVNGRDYLEAARASGATAARQMFVHTLPNVLPPLIVYSTTIAGLLVVYGSGLSFLGLGVQPPTADWGVMAATGRDVLSVAPHISTIPGIMILLVALSFNLLGDGLRDALDPRSHLR